MGVLVLYGVSHDLDETDPEYLIGLITANPPLTNNDRMTPVCQFFNDTKKGKRELKCFADALGPGKYRIMRVGNVKWRKIKVKSVAEWRRI